MFAILVSDENSGDQFMIAESGDVALYTTRDAAQAACAELERSGEHMTYEYRVVTFE
jgi:hypothetical protein